MPRAERRRLRGWAMWLIGTGLVVIAWFVALGTPDDDRIQAPFPVSVAVGEEGVGRNLDVTVTALHRASSVTAGAWKAAGNWVVVDLRAASVVEDRGVLLSHAELQIDGVRYGASERPASLLRQGLTTGVARAGSLAFELPAKLDAGSAVLELAVDGDTRLDSTIVLPFELGDVDRTGEVALEKTGWATP